MVSRYWPPSRPCLARYALPRHAELATSWGEKKDEGVLDSLGKTKMKIKAYWGKELDDYSKKTLNN